MNNTVAAVNHNENCIVCGGVHSQLRFVHNGYSVLCCPDCGLEYVWPTPSAAQLARHYELNYAVSLEKYAAGSDRNVSRIVELER